jgi:hypothetical protein
MEYCRLWLLEHRQEEAEDSRLEKRHFYRKSHLPDGLPSFDVTVAVAGGTDGQ